MRPTILSGRISFRPNARRATYRQVPSLRNGFATLSRLSLAFEVPTPSQDPYWKQVPQWSSVSTDEFINYRWQMKNNVQTSAQLFEFLNSALPDNIPPSTVTGTASSSRQPATRSTLVDDVANGIKKAPMAVRLSPHILSLIDWQNPLSDPLFRQFIPLGSRFRTDHPQLRLDSLNETNDSPVPGLVHRYPDKALFLSTSVCPVYCRFCTRSYSVGTSTESVSKVRFLPIAKRWEPMFAYIERTLQLADVLVSGGDGYSLEPAQLLAIGRRLLATPHIQRIRFASKGLAVCPSRIVDPEDEWASAMERLSDEGRKMGKLVSMQTHFNHPREITWVTELAAKRLFERGVVVRNQSVLLNGVNSDFETMSGLVRKLAELNINPYYIFQGDMVRGVEDLRTPLSTILDLESRLRGTISGYMTPNFMVTLPGGGGKRLACSYESYDRETGLSRFRVPRDFERGWDTPAQEIGAGGGRGKEGRGAKGMGTDEEGGLGGKGGKWTEGLGGEETQDLGLGTVWEYWDPLWSLSETGQKKALERAEKMKEQEEGGMVEGKRKRKVVRVEDDTALATGVGAVGVEVSAEERGREAEGRMEANG